MVGSDAEAEEKVYSLATVLFILAGGGGGAVSLSKRASQVDQR